MLVIQISIMSKTSVTLNITTAYLQVLLDYELPDAAKSQADATSAKRPNPRNKSKSEYSLKVTFSPKSPQATDNLAVVCPKHTRPGKSDP